MECNCDYCKSKPLGSQTKLGSIIESVANVVVGFGVSFAANMIVLPWFGFHVNVSNAISIGYIYTVISIVRSYCLRRVFNRIKKWHR